MPVGHGHRREPGLGHVPALDGLRAVAILAVMLMHFTLLQPPLIEPSRFPDGIIWAFGLSGWIGVDLFFVLSGFLITGILLDTKGGDGYFRNFYMRRVLRIFPLYYGSLLLLFVVIPNVAPAVVHDLARLSHEQLWLWTYVSNWAVALKGSWDATPPLTGHYWSLAVEEQFYLMWPLLVYFTHPRRLLRVAIGIWIIALVLRTLLITSGVSAVSVFVLTPTRMDGLAAGAVIALLARQNPGLTAYRRAARAVFWGGIAGLGLIVAWTGAIRQYDPLTQTVGFALLASTFAAALVGVLTGPDGSRVNALLSHPWARHIGMRSYALYVFHPWVLKAVSRVWHPNEVPLLGSSGVGQQILFWTVCFALSLLAAEASWHLLEKRCLALKRFYPRGVEGLAQSEQTDGVPATP